MRYEVIKNRGIAASLIFAIAFLVFIPSLDNDFVWDDVLVIKSQYYTYQEQDFTSLFFRSDDAGSVDSGEENFYFRPLHHLSYVIDYNLWGENPLGYHLSNSLYFSLSSVLVYFLTLTVLSDLRINRREYMAFAGAVYFAVHPMHVESVSWIAGRTDIICCLFFIAAFIFHIKSLHDKRYVLLSAPLFLFSLLSKEVAATFPFIVLVYHLAGRSREDKGRLLQPAVYFLILGAYLYIRGGVFSSANALSSDIQKAAVAEEGSMFYEIFSAIRVMLGAYAYYFFKMVFPFTFNSFITTVPQGFLAIAASVMSFAVLLFLWFRSAFRGNGVLSLSVTWIVLTLGPSVLVAVFTIATTPLAERYLFIPTAGLALAAGYLGVKLVMYSPSKSASLAILGIFLFSHIYTTVDRQKVWNNRLSLWASASADAADSAIPLLNYGMALIEDGKVDSGIRTLEKALDSEMNATPVLKSMAANNLGIAYLRKRELSSAQDWFRKAVSYNPEYYKSYYHLALVHFTRVRFADPQREIALAERFLKKALELNPEYARGYLMMARVNIAYGRTEQAKEYARKALELGLERPMDQHAIQILEMK